MSELQLLPTKQETIHSWDNVQGNPFRWKPELSMMLLPEGITKFIKIQLKGMTRKGDCEALIKFDKSYVIEYLIKHFFEPLKIQDWNFAVTIIREAYDIYMQRLGIAETSTDDWHREICKLAGIDPNKAMNTYNRTELDAYRRIAELGE